MLEAQGGLCAVCRGPEVVRKRLAVDHDHRCCEFGAKPPSCGECLRGLLCTHCNTRAGGDDPVLALKFAIYVLWWRREHGKATDDDLMLLKDLQGLLSDRGEDGEWLDAMYGDLAVPAVVRF